MTTPADYANKQIKGLQPTFHNGCQENLEVYMKLGYLKMYDTSEVTEIFTSTEGMAGYTELGIHQTPDALKLDDGYNVTITEKRYGGALVVPTTVYKRHAKDNTWKVDDYIAEQSVQLMKTAIHKTVSDAHLMLNEAFDSGSDYLAPDGVEIAGSHSWNSGGTFDNSDTQALDTAAYDDAWEYAGAFTDASGKEMPLNWTDIVVKKGSAAHRTAIQLFAKEIVPNTVGDINIYEGEIRVIETPFYTPANKTKWSLFDLNIAPSPLAVGIGMYPTMDEPIMLENGALRSNVEDFRKQGVINMPFNVYMADGTT